MKMFLTVLMVSMLGINSYGQGCEISDLSDNPDPDMYKSTRVFSVNGVMQNWKNCYCEPGDQVVFGACESYVNDAKLVGFYPTRGFKGWGCGFARQSTSAVYRFRVTAYCKRQ